MDDRHATARSGWRITSRVLVYVVLCVSWSVLSSGADDAQWEWDGIRRIVAVGDVHGAYDNFVAVLQNAGLVDEKQRWIGGDTHLVQNGDVVDRGPFSRKAMDLLMKLEDQAKDAGGYVHALIGNHEAMNIVGILDLVSDEEFAAFADRDSREIRDQTFERYYEAVRREAKNKGEDPPDKGDERRSFEERYPLGYVEHRQAFDKSGRYGKWILSHKVAVKINGIVFSHGDWNEKFAVIGIEEVNQRVPRELAGELPLEDGLTFDAESPLQYRGLAHTPLTRAAQQAQRAKVDTVLGHLEAKRLVVGHTLTTGVIESRFDGKHVSIDTGMLELYHGGHRVALEVVGNQLRAIHDEGTVDIPDTMDETNFGAYIRAVSEVDPHNVDVQLKIVDVLQEENRREEAARILMTLFERPEWVPFRYRDFLGSYYETIGETGLAREQYEAYVKGLSELVRASPENASLGNLLARFCADKGIELDLAEKTIVDTLERSPGNVSFLLTRARVHLAREEFDRALESLGDLSSDGGFGYELHYLRGLAFLGLDDKTRARHEFENAIEAEPTRTEARDEIKKMDEVPLLR
ncbi:MAG TPA: metallophosphoesterase [Vicinamibacteria bacterium]|nr:metallophosphoesterase [Vicinamibacteria bacterium]